MAFGLGMCWLSMQLSLCGSHRTRILLRAWIKFKKKLKYVSLLRLCYESSNCELKQYYVFVQEIIVVIQKNHSYPTIH